MRIFILIALGSLFLSACVHGPTRDKDSTLDYLNGKNYQATGVTASVSDIPVFPVIQRQAQSTQIKGELLLKLTPINEPLRFQTLILKKEGFEFLKTKTDAAGKFNLAGDIPKGNYLLSVQSDRYFLEEPFTVNQWTTENLILLAHVQYSATIRELIEEIRPQPDLGEVSRFIQSAPTIAPSLPLEGKAKILSHYILSQLKITADTSYLARNNKDNILPDSVLQAKKAHCLGLTILFLLAAEKSSLNAYLVRGPDHVFPRLCAESKCVNVEMLRDGEIKDDGYYIKNLLISKEALDRKLYLVSLDSPQELKASVYLGLGFVANHSGQKDIAELFYSKAIQNSAHFAEPHSNLAAIYAETGRLQEAVTELKLAVAINPTHYASLINLGVLEHKAGRENEALSFYSQALTVNPVSVEAYRRRAALYESRRDWKSASLDLERILVVEPRFCDVLQDRMQLAKKDTSLVQPRFAAELSRIQAEKKCLQLPLR